MNFRRFFLAAFVALFAAMTSNAANEGLEPLIQNVYSRDVQSLNGSWHYLLDQLEVGYYDYRKGENGNLTEDDIRIKGLLYVLRNAPKLPIHFIVEHFGFCGRCGEILEGTENINSGLCPLCLEMINNKNN